MKKLKTILLIILSVFLIQIITYYTISKNKLIEQIGLNYESTVLFEKGNYFDEFYVVSELITKEYQITKYFKKFEDIKFETCVSAENCPNLRKSENFYHYFVGNLNKNPFVINKIGETELAKEYGASWESEYIWIIFKWVLIEKRMTGIS